MRHFLTIFYSIICISLFGQDSIRKDLLFFADVMITASEPDHRVRASESFLKLFRTYLEKEESNLDSLQDLKWVSQLNVPGKFRVFTWQIDAENTFPCYGFIQKNGGQLVELLDKKEANPDIEFMSLTPKDWFGHIYYHIEPVVQDSDTIYTLFGFDANSRFNKRKVVEVMQFVDDKVIFGKEIFRFPVEGSRDLIKYRVGFEYSADAVMSVNYNAEMNLIVFDHLQQVIGQMPGQGPTMVPDGTYEGLSYDGKYWNYNEKLFHEIMDEAPRPKPILDGKKKDIIGRKN
jgi:hypothetical protein